MFQSVQNGCPEELVENTQTLVSITERSQSMEETDPKTPARTNQKASERHAEVTQNHRKWRPEGPQKSQKNVENGVRKGPRKKWSLSTGFCRYILSPFWHSESLLESKSDLKRSSKHHQGLPPKNTPPKHCIETEKNSNRPSKRS